MDSEALEINWRDLILFEDAGLIAVNKPAGLLSQKDKSGDPDVRDSLLAYGKRENRTFTFLAPAHRLDRNTSGVLLLAKNPDTAARISKWLKEQKLKKIYWAIVKGDPGENGTIDLPLDKDPEKNQSFVHASGKNAITKFRREKKFSATSLMEISMETGRSHQIRAHFAAIQHPLIGDKKYGKKPWSSIFDRPALHAYSLELPKDSSGKPLLIKAPLPKDFLKLLQQLGG